MQQYYVCMAPALADAAQSHSPRNMVEAVAVLYICVDCGQYAETRLHQFAFLGSGCVVVDERLLPTFPRPGFPLAVHLSLPLASEGDMLAIDVKMQFVVP